MSFSSWLIYASVVLASTLSPGPAILLAVSNAVAYGRRAAALSSLGNIFSLFFMAAVAMAGIGTLLQSAPWVLGVLKILGALYLVYLGIRRWQLGGQAFAFEEGAVGRRPARQLFLQGAMLALTNPKAILFFAALFPPFMAADRPLIPQFALLTGTLMLFSFLSLMIYAWVANSARTWLLTPGRALWFNRLSGTIFVLLGIGVLLLDRAAS